MRSPHRLGIDPIDVRRRNAITKEEMPYHRPLEALGEEIEHDSGDYCGLLDRVLAETGWDGDQGRRRAPPRRRRTGRCRGSRCSSRRAGSARPTACASRSIPTAWSKSITGGASLGQGFETVMAQVCAEGSASTTRIRVIHGQTDRIEFGIGAHASRATVMTASATHNGALKVRAKALEMAAELMQSRPTRSTSSTAG